MAEAEDLVAAITVLAVLLVLVACSMVFMILRLRAKLRQIEERSKQDLEKQDATTPLSNPAAPKESDLSADVEQGDFSAEAPYTE
jgi:hypothetical protein